jgi:hypothetical protein
MILEIPCSRWGASPYVGSPIPFPADIVAEIASKEQEEAQATQAMDQRRQHPFQLALLWRQEMEADSELDKAKIAAREGISRARVTQIMDLLQLPTSIQSDLLCPPAPLGIHSFPERRLRTIFRRGDEVVQIRRWHEMLQKLVARYGE